MLPQYALLRDADVAPLAEGVLDVLAKVGVFCQNREALEAMERRGARVAYAEERATFPREMVEEVLEQVRAEGTSRPAPAEKRFRPPGLPRIGTQIAQFVYDFEAQRPVAGSRERFVELTKFGSSLEPDAPVGHGLLLRDVPPMVEPLEAALLLAEHAAHPLPAFAWNVRQVDYLIEMGDILGIPNWFSWGAVCFAHPLRFDKDVADKFVRRVREGASTGLTAMPVVGVSTPVTVAGFITVAAAEIVATWLAVRSLNPDCPVGGSVWPGTVDMRTGSVSYGALDAMAYGFALHDFLLRWTGKAVSISGAEYCSAKAPGYYAAMEKANKAMTIAAFTGSHPGMGQGMLDEGKTLCPEQLLLERDLGLGVQILGREVEVSPDTMQVDAILEVAHGLTRSHLDSEATARRFRDCLWCPEVLDRSGWRGAETDDAVLRQLHRKARDLIAASRPPDVDPDKLARMRQVVARAKRDLLN